MENQLQTTKGAYLTDLQQLDGETLRNFVDPKHQASPQELQTLLAIVKNRNLNPFTKEVYFIKYGNNPAQIVVSKDAFMKRAEQNQNYDGFESGVIYEDEKGELKTKKGVILPRKATLIGGWCEVYRKDRSRPVYREVELSAYNTHKNWWQKAPGQMIEKVAIVAAVRDAFSENVGGVLDTFIFAMIAAYGSSILASLSALGVEIPFIDKYVKRNIDKEKFFLNSEEEKENTDND